MLLRQTAGHSPLPALMSSTAVEGPAAVHTAETGAGSNEGLIPRDVQLWKPPPLAARFMLEIRGRQQSLRSLLASSNADCAPSTSRPPPVPLPSPPTSVEPLSAPAPGAARQQRKRSRGSGGLGAERDQSQLLRFFRPTSRAREVPEPHATGTPQGLEGLRGGPVEAWRSRERSGLTALLKSTGPLDQCQPGK